MIRTLLRRDTLLRRNSLLFNCSKVSISSNVDPDQKLRDNVRYLTVLIILLSLILIIL